MERDYKEHQINNFTFELYDYMTAGDYQALQDMQFEMSKVKGEVVEMDFTKRKYSSLDDFVVESMVRSVQKEGSEKITTNILATIKQIPVKTFKELLKVIGEITNDEVKK